MPCQIHSFRVRRPHGVRTVSSAPVSWWHIWECIQGFLSSGVCGGESFGQKDLQVECLVLAQSFCSWERWPTISPPPSTPNRSEMAAPFQREGERPWGLVDASSLTLHARSSELSTLPPHTYQFLKDRSCSGPCSERTGAWLWVCGASTRAHAGLGECHSQLPRAVI